MTMVDAMIGQCEVDAMITMVSDHIIGSHTGHSDDGPVVMMISADGQKGDAGQWKDVMIASRQCGTVTRSQ